MTSTTIAGFTQCTFESSSGEPNRLSRGGGWAIHFGLILPDLFGAVGGHSPAIFDSEGPRLRRMLDAVPPDQMPRWFLDVGEDDRLVASALSFAQTLAERGIAHDWRLYTGAHNEAYWSSHVEEYLRWYAQGWDQQPEGRGQ